MSYNDLSEERKLDIISFGEPVLMFFLAPMEENGALSQDSVSQIAEHFHNKDCYANSFAALLCKPYEVQGTDKKFRCGIMNTVTANKVYFVMPNEWNAPVVTVQSDASLNEIPDRLDYFLDRSFDGFLPLSDRAGSPLKDMGIYVVCLAVKLDDTDGNLQSIVNFSELAPSL